MNNSAGNINLCSPTAHCLASAPAERSRQRVGARPYYIAIPGEEVAAIRAAESFLIDFCGADFAAIQWELRPAAVRAAIGNLVVIAIHNAAVAEIFFDPVATVANVTKTALRKQVGDRCWLYRNFSNLHSNRETRKQAVAEFEKAVAT